MSGLIFGLIMLALAAGTAVAGKHAHRVASADGIKDALVIPTIRWTTSVLGAIAGMTALWSLLGTSYVIIGAYEVGHLNRIYLGSSMPPGQVMALKGQAGPQAKALPPGIHIKFLLNVIYDVEKIPVVEIPTDHYGFVVARDGAPLGPGQILADRWPDAIFTQMVDAEYFLSG